MENTKMRKKIVVTGKRAMNPQLHDLRKATIVVHSQAMKVSPAAPSMKYEAVSSDTDSSPGWAADVIDRAT